MTDYSVDGSNAKPYSTVFPPPHSIPLAYRKESNGETRKVLFPIMSRDGRNTEIVMCSVNKVNRQMVTPKKRGCVR